MGGGLLNLCRGLRHIAAAVTVAWVGLATAQTGVASAPPGWHRLELRPIAPTQADAAVRAWRRPAGLITQALPDKPTSTPRSTSPTLISRVSGDAAPVGPASIPELARALKNDPDLIYEYVRNNIEYYPVWGVHKGTLGTVLDNQGTALDQAPPMVTLMRQAGITASVVKGEIDLTPSMVSDWTGIDSSKACPVIQFFGVAGTPISKVNNGIGISCPGDLNGVSAGAAARPAQRFRLSRG